MKERCLLMTPVNYGRCKDGSKTQTRRIMEFQPGPDATWYAQLRTSGKDSDLWFPMKGDPKDMDCWEQAEGKVLKCPYGVPGDRLYVKEGLERHGERHIQYRRDKAPLAWFDGTIQASWEWRRDTLSPLHMLKWAARLWLEIVDVRVERLQEITEVDAIAEGCPSDLRRETWWQGYRSDMMDRDDNLLHWQAPRCDAPPSTMLDPKQMTVTSGNTATYNYRVLWHQIHGPGSWDMNPWLWCLTFKKVRD